MLIDKLRVHNFRCFRGTHEIDLATTAASNVVVIYGENMRGKTTLLQAIRWALYGEVRDRDNNEIAVLDPENKEQLLSQEADFDEDYTLRVEIEFEHEGSRYLLRRVAQASGNPTSSEEFNFSVNLKQDAHELAEKLVDTHIQSVLSNDVSRFFLFDGEMLQEYERLLNNPDQEALTVKDSIEKILGLPALYVYEDLGEEASRDEKLLNTQLRKRAKYSDLVAEVMRLENDVTSFKRDLASLEKSMETLQQETDEAELAVSRMGDLEKNDREKSTLEQQIQSEQQQKADNQDAIREMLSNIWWLPVAGVIEKRLDDIHTDIQTATSNLETIRRIEALKASIEEKTCQLCGLPLDKQKRDVLKKEITRLKLENFAVLDGPETEGLVLGDLVRRQQIYERFRAQDAVREIVLRQENIDAAQVAISDCEAKIAVILAKNAGRDFGDMKEKTERFKLLSGQLQDAKQRVKKTADRLKEAEAEHQAKQRQLSSLPEADPSLRLQSVAYRELSEVFQAAVDVFRESLREKVGQDASNIFKQLTTEEAYSGLSINNQYGLSLLDSNGKPIPGRSAGAEQIVALSLIGGLNRAAVREGPVVMDTNFGRLDTGHRENVLRFLPELGRQVIVLVHSGELPKDTELSDLGVRVARRYEVVRKTETSSEIRELV